jgi:curli production assembly/transport component CsgG/holdfast attachment protein HfaB
MQIMFPSTTVRKVLVPILAGAAVLAQQGCASTTANRTTGLYTRPMGNAPVTHNDTPYSRPLVCLASYARESGVKPPRIAVGRIADMTGKSEQITGTQLTQGASLFAMSALGKAGERLVERYDTAVPEIELRYAGTRLLSDAPERAGKDPENYRRTLVGQIAGSDYYIVGGITELNANIRSGGLDGTGGSTSAHKPKGTLEHTTYVMNVAIDLRLVDSRSQEVVNMVSYQKQIVGRQVSLGVFDFFHGNIIDVAGGTSGVEPQHLAVRSLIERGVFEFVANLYGLKDPRACLPAQMDPLGAY